MTDQKTDSTRQEAVRRAQAFAQQLLDDGVEPPDIVFALASVATDLGIQAAPNPIDAFPLLLSAVVQVTSCHADKTAGDDGDNATATKTPDGKTIH